MDPLIAAVRVQAGVGQIDRRRLTCLLEPVVELLDRGGHDTPVKPRVLVGLTLTAGKQFDSDQAQLPDAAARQAMAGQDRASQTVG